MNPHEFSLGVGIDIVEIKSFTRMGKQRCLQLFLTSKELKTVPKTAKRNQFLAGRFALKEAVIKASPTMLRPLDFEIKNLNKKPIVIFLEKFPGLTALCSISHSKLYAVAMAIVTTNTHESP